jgi:RNA polymerase sigma-70 factor, ECF subfamily
MTEAQGVSGLDDQFAELRPVLTSYCYRMLGSTFDADDAVQETLMRAWRAFDCFDGRATLRTWLFSIATNVCLTHLRHARRRAVPMSVRSESNSPLVLGAPLPRETWVEPVPDSWVIPPNLEPEELAVQRESVRLAFVAALQLLTPRQRAVLLLRDVLKFRVREVADLLDTTEDAVNATLRRARATLASWEPEPLPPPPGERDRELLDRYVDAFERFDIAALVALLHEDATLSMPPFALWLRGPTAIGAWYRATGAACENSRMVPINANGTPGFALYRHTTNHRHHQAFAIQIVETTGRRISALHTFLDPSLFPYFDLDPMLAPSDRGAHRPLTQEYLSRE